MDTSQIDGKIEMRRPNDGLRSPVDGKKEKIPPNKRKKEMRRLNDGHQPPASGKKETIPPNNGLLKVMNCLVRGGLKAPNRMRLGTQGHKGGKGELSALALSLIEKKRASKITVSIGSIS